MRSARDPQSPAKASGVLRRLRTHAPTNRVDSIVGGKRKGEPVLKTRPAGGISAIDDVVGDSKPVRDRQDGNRVGADVQPQLVRVRL